MDLDSVNMGLTVNRSNNFLGKVTSLCYVMAYSCPVLGVSLRCSFLA